MPPLDQWRGRDGDAERMERAFPVLAASLQQPQSRRHVMRLMAASMALGGLSGCGDPSAPDGQYVPAVNQAPDIIPGLPNRYATAFLDGGAAAGIVVTHQMGRPIKIEGNAAHPASLGATSIFGQALLLDFYDPDRSAGLREGASVSTWQALERAMVTQRDHLAATRGAGFRILTGRVMSPTLGVTIDGLLAQYPQARWHQWEPLSRQTVRRGTEIAYGQAHDALFYPGAANVILALDSDLIGGAPGHLANARGFASRRNPSRAVMSRVYAAEPAPTLIGMAADHRLVASPAELNAAVAALAATVLDGARTEGPAWVAAASADLRAAGPRALVHAGPYLSAEAHALVHLINERLGARGTTFDLIAPVAHRDEDQDASAAALLDDMRDGRVDTLLILDSNPAYTLPGFTEALARVSFSMSASPSRDETARAVTWSVPLAHVFEAWGNARAHDGTVSIQQPQALPLYGGRSVYDVLSLFTDGTPVQSLGIVRDAHRTLDDDAWEDALGAGIVPNTASAPVKVQPITRQVTLSRVPAPALALLVRPDPNLQDGRHANNPWLQELPRSQGKLVWDNPLLLAPATAARLGVENGDELELSVAGKSVTAPAWIIPGQSETCVIAWLGGGRTSAGEVGNNVGTDFTSLRDAAGEVTLRRTGGHTDVASTDHHNILDVETRTIDHVVRHATLAAFTADADAFREAPPPSIFARAQQSGVAWGMSVDLNACIGCNACIVACQAENNVPVVGKDQVLMGREMHWLRIDRYHEGLADNPDTLLQPMLCMHCEDAPCEPVCPVEASVHDGEGLNLQVYNRCIGTRFCSNNCPYKVRRFNFGAWARDEHRTDISRNPDVTVRSRGVMEKCTFCVQRIAQARIEHDRDGRKEEVVTACQAACPTRVFTFGDINDPDSEVARRKHSPLDYALLPEANTRPRLTYEARIFNRNPALEA